MFLFLMFLTPYFQDQPPATTSSGTASVYPEWPSFQVIPYKNMPLLIKKETFSIYLLFLSSISPFLYGFISYLLKFLVGLLSNSTTWVLPPYRCCKSTGPSIHVGSSGAPLLLLMSICIYMCYIARACDFHM